jgi:hypothetical protein
MDDLRYHHFNNSNDYENDVKYAKNKKKDDNSLLSPNKNYNQKLNIKNLNENENLYKSKSFVWTNENLFIDETKKNDKQNVNNQNAKTSEFISQSISLPPDNKLNVLTPIVLPNIKNSKNLFVKELNADNYAVLSAQWHQNRKKNDNNQRTIKSKSMEVSTENCKFDFFLVK